MTIGTDSATARYQAAFRALESVRRPAGRRLFQDPFAAGFLNPELKRYVRLAALPLIGERVRAIAEWRSGGAMSSGIARTRLIDDHLREAVLAGVGQVLLLGAGYDCRAQRMPELSPLRVVEMDLSSTQAAKKLILARMAGGLPGNVAYLQADLMKDELAGAWSLSGLDGAAPVFVIWEGVAHYLGGAAVDRTLRALAALLAPGSLLAFTYIHAGLLDGTVRFARAEVPKRRVLDAGEPWIWGMDPARMPGYLRERGFELLQDLGADEYRFRFWGSAACRLKGFAFYRVALARRA
jgi:methyltransferase (TIGR00027 family)